MRWYCKVDLPFRPPSCHALKMASPTSAGSYHPARASPFVPISVLERAGIKLCIIGNAAVRLFGSGLVIADLDLAIADEQFDLALSILHDEGFRNIDSGFHASLRQTWRLGRSSTTVPPTSGNVVLSPASCWLLEINPDTTLLRSLILIAFPSLSRR